MRIVIILLVCCFSSHAVAWGQTGHRVIARIAQDYLTPQAAAMYQTLLPTEGLPEISTYADEMRSDPDEYWQKTTPPWHYVTIPHGQHYDQVGAPPQGDAISAYHAYRATFLDLTQPLALRIRALKMIVHIVGDLHQPLHAGNGTDRGGNDVKVEYFWAPSNLHRVWDSGMIDGKKLSYTEWHQWLAVKITSAQAARWQAETSPIAWAHEGQRLHAGLYPPKADKIKLNYRYQYVHMPTVKRRLQMGGVRTAAVLNALFAELAEKQKAVISATK